MAELILEISERGQITIPKKIRAQFKGQWVSLTVEKDKIILSPVQTVEQFLNELDEAHQDWKKNGGIGVSDLRKKYQS